MSRTAPNRSTVGLILLTCAVLVPFIAKPVHMDDPIFLWPAERILAGDAKPFEVAINWYGFTEPLAQVTKNPPAVSYCLAAIAAVAGWSEPALHTGMLIFGIGVVLGVCFIARHLIGDGIGSAGTLALAAGAMALASPALPVSATSLMSDVPMLCFWTWAVGLWLWARTTDRPWAFLLAGAMAGAGAACKYPGIFVVPLLAVCATQRQRWPWQAAGLVIAIGVLLLVDAAFGSRSEPTGLPAAVAYAAERFRRATELPAQLLTGLSYLGGAFLPAGAALILCLRWRELCSILIMAAALTMAALVWPEALMPLQRSAEAHRGLVAVHAFIFMLAGLAVLAGALTTLWRDRDRAAALLACWILGIFLFATLLNWTTNVRAMLPMAPAVAMLAVRRAAQTQALNWRNWRLAVPIAAGLLLSSGIALADYRWAAASRHAAETFFKRSIQIQRTKWFVGHWGFQWYMQKLGALPVDYESSTLWPGDLLVWPVNNTNPIPMPPGTLERIDTIDVPTFGWFSTLETSRGTNFYTSQVGPLPWCVGGSGSEQFIVYRVIRPSLPPGPRE